MPAIRPQSKSQISSQSPRIVWPLPAEILELFPVKRAATGDNAIHSAWYTAQRLSTMGIRRNSACYRARHGSPCLTYDGLYHLRMNSVFGRPLSPITRRGFIRLTIRGGNDRVYTRGRALYTQSLYGIFNLIIRKWIKSREQ